jgi:SSS family solute:Na+ symporter
VVGAVAVDRRDRDEHGDVPQRARDRLRRRPAGHTGDLRFLQLPLGYLLGRAIAAFGLLPLYFRGELFTAYDVLRSAAGRPCARSQRPVPRHAHAGRRTAALPDGLVLQVMLGWSLSTSVAVTGLVTVVYTVLGGIKAVVWTDVMQFVVYMLGAIAALFVLGGTARTAASAAR